VFLRAKGVKLSDDELRQQPPVIGRLRYDENQFGDRDGRGRMMWSGLRRSEQERPDVRLGQAKPGAQAVVGVAWQWSFLLGVLGGARIHAQFEGAGFVRHPFEGNVRQRGLRVTTANVCVGSGELDLLQRLPGATASVPHQRPEVLAQFV
jgi:hypothetical protein